MTVKRTALDRVEAHWAVVAIQEKQRNRAQLAAKHKYVQGATSGQLEIDFAAQPQDEAFIRNLALAYELAATEGVRALLHSNADAQQRENAVAGAYRAYELLRTLPVPRDDDERVLHVLHVASLGYAGDRWTDLRRWLLENKDLGAVPSAALALWDRRLLYRIFDCWIRLFRKNRWDDLHGVSEVVAALRRDQPRLEPEFLNESQDAKTRSVACRLLALYNWAKATEVLAEYMIQGGIGNIDTKLDQHFDAARDAAGVAGDPSLEVLMRWLHVAARQMTANSVWRVTERVNSRVTKFLTQVTKTRAMFELLPPQRAALLEHGLLDPAAEAVVVELPTSGGKTALAQFRILQALNQFDADNGWVAYVAPTRALTAQLCRRFREDFEPLGIRVEMLSAAVEVDSFEESMLKDAGTNSSFHVLVSTPEKLDLVIRNKKVSRPLALLVVDEAHNIEDEERGLRLELLMATAKRDCSKASFLLLMPYVPNAKELARWLGPHSGKEISLATSAWQPNERIIGMYAVKPLEDAPKSWRLTFETLQTSQNTIHLKGVHFAGAVSPLPTLTTAKVRTSLTLQTGAIAKVFSERSGTSLAVARTIRDAWTMAREIARALTPLNPIHDDVALVQRFLRTEFGKNFELAEMLSVGVAVHHAGLSDEARALIEWLAETGKLRVLCSTTTVLQGINFPVSSVFLASCSVPHSRHSEDMSPRSFWNLAGRAGRINQGSVGVVGIAAGTDANKVRKFVARATDALVSRLLVLLEDADRLGTLNSLDSVLQQDQWNAFRSYVAHLVNERKELGKVIAETEQLLRNTFGYGALQGKGTQKDQQKAKALLEATKNYARSLIGKGLAELADATGFAPEGVGKALASMSSDITRKLTSADWQPESLFGNQSASVLPELIGVMMRVPEIQQQLKEFAGKGLDHRRVAEVTRAWVSGESIEAIAKRYFQDDNESTTDAISHACKAIYRNLSNASTWGLSALSKLTPSGLDFERMSEDERRRINSLPAMIYYGVKTEAALLMRINAVPRSVAESLGSLFEARVPKAERGSHRTVRDFLKRLRDSDWAQSVPKGSPMSGPDYRTIWTRLTGG